MSYNSYYIVKIIIHNYTKMLKVCGVLAGACGVQVSSCLQAILKYQV